MNCYNLQVASTHSLSQPKQLWLESPLRPHLADGEVHVWRVDLDKDSQTVQALWDLLSPDELMRAEKFRFQRDREHFVVARGMLRLILGRYLDLTARQMVFTYNKYGKPALSSQSADNELRFNISHSYGLALFAITSGREIGIDLEYARADFAGLELAEHFFSPAEIATLRALSSEARTTAFFNCWTRKEAYIKARGEGLSYPLHQFTVSVGSGEPISLLNNGESESGGATAWSLIELYPGERYRAALAIESGYPLRLRCLQVPEVRAVTDLFER